MENQEKDTITVVQLQREFVDLATKAVMALVLVFVYSIIQLFRIGNQSDYLLIFSGCILSVMAIFGYIINELTNGVKKKKSYLAMMLTLGGFVPWAFGIYLVFVGGFWSLKNLSNGFSLAIILKSVIFIYLGFVIVSKFHLITEIGEGIRSGKWDIKE